MKPAEVILVQHYYYYYYTLLSDTKVHQIVGNGHQIIDIQCLVSTPIAPKGANAPCTRSLPITPPTWPSMWFFKRRFLVKFRIYLIPDNARDRT